MSKRTNYINDLLQHYAKLRGLEYKACKQIYLSYDGFKQKQLVREIEEYIAKCKKGEITPSHVLIPKNEQMI